MMKRVWQFDFHPYSYIFSVLDSPFISLENYNKKSPRIACKDKNRVKIPLQFGAILDRKIIIKQIKISLLYFPFVLQCFSKCTFTNIAKHLINHVRKSHFSINGYVYKVFNFYKQKECYHAH